MRISFLLALTACTAFAGPVRSQDDPTGSITCVVIDDIRMQPVREARLALTGGKLEAPLDGRTDSAGSFTFTGLPFARYTIAVERAGYFPRVSAAPQDGGPVTVNLGPSGATVSVTMVKIRTITGTVKWEDGEPASDSVLVHALRLRRGQATFRLGDAILTPVKSDGQFKIDNLRPGRYVVYAYHLGWSKVDRPRVALPVFYPDSPSPDGASSVDLSSSAEASPLQLKLRDVGGVSVEGTVVASPDFPEGTPVRVGLMVTGSPAQVIAATGMQPARAGSAFRILDVPPGSYQLIGLPIPSQNNMKTAQPLQVSTEAIKDVRVVMVKSAPIAGRIQVETIAPARPDAGPSRQDSGAQPGHLKPAAGVDISGMSPDLQLMGLLSQRTNAAGEFRLEGTVDGQTYLTDIRAPKGSYLYRVTQDGRDLDGAPFPLTGGGGTVNVLLRDDGGTVDGVARDKDGKPSAGFIVLAPKDRLKEHLYRTAPASEDGLFQLQDVAPGDYELFALDRNEYDMYFVPKYLDQFRKTASAVSMTSSAAFHFALEIAATGQSAR